MDSGPRIYAMRIDSGADTLYAELISRDMADPMDESPETVLICHGLGGNHTPYHNSAFDIAEESLEFSVALLEKMLREA